VYTQKSNGTNIFVYSYTFKLQYIVKIAICNKSFVVIFLFNFVVLVLLAQTWRLHWLSLIRSSILVLSNQVIGIRAKDFVQVYKGYRAILSKIIYKVIIVVIVL
jgi:hypothetical protein